MPRWMKLANIVATGLMALLPALALAQPAPPSQCVSAAVAGGTANALTVPKLPCGATTTLLIMTTGATANTTVTPTLQEAGRPAFPLVRFDGSSLAIGELSASSKFLLTFNGSDWFVLNGAGASSTNPVLTGGLGLCNGFASCSGETTTATGAAGQSLVTLASAIDFPSSCIAGALNCGIVVGGAGAAFTLGQPTGLTVAGACSAKNFTGNTVIGSPLITGANVIQGLAAGDKITIGAGIPANTSITDFSVTTGIIRLSANATATNTGTAFTAADPCTSTYFYRVASYDANGGIGAPTVAASTATGPATTNPTWNVVCVTWTAPGGTQPAGYVIWRSLDGGATYHFQQTSTVAPTGACAVGTNGPFWDGGQTPQAKPWWIPDNPNTIAGSGQPDWLATTVAGGGGTTAVTLATPLLSAVTGTAANGMVVHDDTAGWLAWFTALNLAGGAEGIINAPAVVRLRSGGSITTSNVRIRGQRGATIQPFGANVGKTIDFNGGSTAGAYTVNNNFTEGNNCLPVTGISSVGAWVFILQNGPGGPSQAQQYNHISPVIATACPSGGVQLADAAGITFTDALHTELATISGTIAVGDTLTLTIAGDVSCSSVYTVVATDTSLTTLARSVALKWLDNCSAATGITATNTGAAVQLNSPSYLTTMTWSSGTAHGGGGTEAIALSQGHGYDAFTIPGMLSNVGISSLAFLGSDAVSNATGAGEFVGVRALHTVGSRFADLDFVNFGEGQAFGAFNNYRNVYEDFYLANGAGGVPNIVSYDDFIVSGDTKSLIKKIQSVNSQSFGPQIAESSWVTVEGLKTAGAQFGRGFKIGSTVASQFTDVESTDAVFDNMILCCGSYRNIFTNFRTAHARGVNQDGLSMFDSWDSYNTFIGYKGVGSRYDIITNMSDIQNQWHGIDVGIGGGFYNTFVQNSNIFYDINGCPAAVNQAPLSGGTLTCQIGNGSWTPTLAGSTLIGSTSYSTQFGSYQRNWHDITVRWGIITSAALTGMTGNAIILGIPTAQVASEAGACAIANWGGLTLDAGYTALTGTVASSLVIGLDESGSTLGPSLISIANFTNPVKIYGTCTYRVW